MGNQSLKCSQLVRAIPLERFRLSKDGRKWRHVARSRKSLLSYLSTYANSDGTFVRDGRNYSPGDERLLKDFSNGSLYRLLNDLRELGLLWWTRKHHYDRREFTIHLDKIEPETPPTFADNHLPHSEKTAPTFDQNHLQHSTESAENTSHIGENHLQHSQKTPPTVGAFRLCPPVAVKREGEEPSAEKQNLSRSLDSKPVEQRTEQITVDYVMERAKGFDGKVSFSKTARKELHDALQQLSEDGPLSKDEIDNAINAKLKMCNREDPTSYVIFGSSLAADLVASIRVKRQRKAESDATHEKYQRWEQWKKEFRAIRDDLTVDIGRWAYLDHMAPDGFEQEVDSLWDEAEAYRENLYAQRQAEPVALPAD